MELAAESEFDVTIVNETVDQPLPTSGPSSPRNTGCKLPLTTNCWWRISALFLAGACFQRIASVS